MQLTNAESSELIVAFLTHLYIIVQMRDEEPEEESCFFMPSALVCAPDDYFIDAEVSVDSTLLCFNACGYSPKGVFSSIIAYLPKHREEPVNLEWYLPSILKALYAAIKPH